VLLGRRVYSTLAHAVSKGTVYRGRMLFLVFLVGSALAAPAPLSVSPGDAALVFELPAVNERAAVKLTKSTSISLADFVGIAPAHARRAVLLHFYTPSKGTEALPALQQISKRYASKGVLVLGVCSAQIERRPASTCIPGTAPSFPILDDGHGIVSSRYGVSDYPLTLVIDAKGHVFAIGQPQGAVIEAEIEAELKGLLQD